MVQPRLFLSPSTQEYNPYINGGNEEYYTNLIADAMEPYLMENGVSVTRNDPEGTVGTSVRMSNAGDYDLHLAISRGRFRGRTSTTTGGVRGAAGRPRSTRRIWRGSTPTRRRSISSRRPPSMSCARPARPRC